MAPVNAPSPALRKSARKSRAKTAAPQVERNTFLPAMLEERKRMLRERESKPAQDIPKPEPTRAHALTGLADLRYPPLRPGADDHKRYKSRGF